MVIAISNEIPTQETMKEILYKQLRNLPCYKNADYLKWLRERNPDKTIHHLIGSMTGIKLNDYLLIPLTIQEHEEAERHKIEFCIDNLHIALNNLFEWVNTITK